MPDIIYDKLRGRTKEDAMRLSYPEEFGDEVPKDGDGDGKIYDGTAAETKIDKKEDEEKNAAALMHKAADLMRITSKRRELIKQAEEQTVPFSRDTTFNPETRKYHYDLPSGNKEQISSWQTRLHADGGLSGRAGDAVRGTADWLMNPENPAWDKYLNNRTLGGAADAAKQIGTQMLSGPADTLGQGVDGTEDEEEKNAAVNFGRKMAALAVSR